MKELIEKIKGEMEAFCKDADAQMLKGNKAAGTRARKSALELSKMMKASPKKATFSRPTPQKTTFSSQSSTAEESPPLRF